MSKKLQILIAFVVPLILAVLMYGFYNKYLFAALLSGIEIAE